jgi:predicted ribosome quality control (RQC) complex YloA/Tae2 family protein
MKIELFTHGTKDYTISIGQNKEENWQLIDSSEPNDVWFHIDDQPSCHVVLKNENNIKLRDFPRQVLKRASYLCKINSAAKRSPKCDVIYTLISSITKTSVVGQVVVANTCAKLISL